MIVAWDFDGVLNRNIVDGRLVWADDFEADIGRSNESFSEYVFAENFHNIVTGKEDLRDRVADWVQVTSCETSADDILAYWFAKDALPDPETGALLHWLAKAGVRQVIATNNEARRARYIETEMGFGGRVERVFASGRMGVAKPDPAYFEQITQTLGADPTEMLLIDDHAPNVAASRALGWEAFHFTDATRNGLAAVLPLDRRARNAL